MSVFTRRPLLAALAAVSLFTVAACGESAVDNGSADSAATPDADSTATGEATAASRDTLVLASIPSEESSSIDQQYNLVVEVLEDELGVDIEMQSVTSYAALIEAQSTGNVDIAAYGPFSYVSAKDSGLDITPIAVPADAPDEKPSYQSYGIVAADSEIQDISEFADKTICFVDPTSTSGFLYPSAGLMDAGIDPENDIEQVFAGGHDASALSVADGTCDGGFAFDDMVDVTLVEDGSIQEGDLRVIWRSEEISSSPIALDNNLDSDLHAQITEIFLEKLNVTWLTENGYCDSEDSCILPEDSWGYIATEDTNYDGVREVCEITEADACQV